MKLGHYHESCVNKVDSMLVQALVARLLALSGAL